MLVKCIHIHIIEKLFLFPSGAGASVDDRFECELTGSDGQVKKLKFNAVDIKSVRRGKGRTISMDEDDRLCMNINIQGKGELNVSLPSEAERDAGRF